MSEEEKSYKSGLQRVVFDMIKEDIRPAIKEEVYTSVKEIVNGKIDRLTTTQQEDRKVLADYILRDEAWKIEIAPVIKAGQVVRTTFIGLKYFGAFLAAGGGLVIMIASIINIIK